MSITPKDVIVDTEKTLGNNLLIVGVRPVLEYENGKSTGRVNGTSYEVVAADRNYRNFRIKVPGDQTIAFDGTPIKANFNGVHATCYVYNGSFGLSIVAESVAISDQKKER